MRSKVLLVLLVLCSLSLRAADKIQPLDIKLGLWEITSTNAMTGMPPIPSDVLAKMTPEQRAKMEAALSAKSGGSTTTRKVCVTREKMDKQTAFNEERNNCTHTVVTSSSSRLEMKMQCTEREATMNGTIHVEALNSETVKGSVRMAMAGGGRNLNTNSDFTSRYLGSACGDVK